MTTQPQQQNVIDCINVTFAGLEKAQKEGVFSFEESTKLYSSMIALKEYFTKMVEAQKTAQQPKKQLEPIMEL